MSASATKEHRALPTVGEMRDFASRFSRREWDTLCCNKRFLILFTDDLGRCRLHAEKALHKAQAAPAGGA